MKVELAAKEAQQQQCYFPLWSCENYPLLLPEGHPFPNRKYPILEELLSNTGFKSFIKRCTVVERRYLELVHTPSYIDRVLNMSLSVEELRRVGFPNGQAYVNRALASVQGTLSATREVLERGWLCAGVLAGGTHHAFVDRGEGYCTFNDAAVAARYALQNALDRVLIVDLDAHQGNGTASIFASEPRVFTFSMHAEENYPRQKERSTLDLGLPLGTKDDDYLFLLREHLPIVIDYFKPDLALFQSGVDVLAEDRFGRLGLSMEGLRQRDIFVFENCFSRRVPVVITLGGGYQRNHENVARAHAQTFLTASRLLHYFRE